MSDLGVKAGRRHGQGEGWEARESQRGKKDALTASLSSLTGVEMIIQMKTRPAE